MQPELSHSHSPQPLPSAGDARRERGVRAVIALTVVTMTLEIAAGYWTGSMALVADGWHMATHVGALGLAAAAYAVSRHFSSHRAFAFGTGKVHALAGYTSAVALGLVALDMVVESISRLLEPRSIDFANSLPVAVVGLVVNLASVKLLHDDTHEPHAHDHEGHDHGDETLARVTGTHAAHDHNHRAAVVHVMADTCTSALAIGALLAGRFLGWTWLDPITGIVGGGVILAWGISLCRNAALDLLNVDPSGQASEEIRVWVEAMHDVQVSDLRVWPLGRGARGCVMTLSAESPRDVSEYRTRVLGAFPFEHLTIEVRRHRAPLQPGPVPEA
jgi:cation diffusion facilitator family transporter